MTLKNVFLMTAASMVLAGAALAQPYGMGPGMMGGYGYGMGPGMMGGYGMGHGMMGGYGGAGMGPGMMFGDSRAAYAGLDLAPEQRKKINDIGEESSKAMWQLMGTMHQQDNHMRGMFGPGALDESAARKSFQSMTETHKAMFEMQLEARKKIDAVLTKEQREKLRQYWIGR